jgi:hypothetical protein
MNIRIIIGAIGTVLAMVSGSLLAFGVRLIAVQLCLVAGVSTVFITIGVEHFYRVSPMLDRFPNRKAKVIVGCVFIVIGVGLLAAVGVNLLALRVH